MEPEEHIYFYGVDHYLETLFPKIASIRKMRRKTIILLLFTSHATAL